MKRETRAGSLPYTEAGERMRLSQARLVGARANLRAWRVAAAVWCLTVGYSKAWDAVYVDGLAELTGMDERSVRRGIKECAAAGALEWLPSRGGQEHRRPSLIGLPEATGPSKPGCKAQPGRSSPVDNRAVAARLPSNEVESVEVMSSEVPSDTGTHHSPLTTASEGLDGLGSVPGVGEAGTPEPADPAALYAELDAALGTPEADEYADVSPAVRQSFGLDNPDAWHGDERTGEAVGDDEAAQVRWVAANPRKTRRRGDA